MATVLDVPMVVNTPHGGGPQSDVEDDLESISHELLQGISSHAIFKLNSEGYIEHWPDSAAALYGYEPDEVVGEHLSTLFADEVGQSPALGELLAEANADTQESEHWHERADGSGFWATLTVSPLRDATVHGYAVVSRDTTRRKEYEQMLERQNDRLKEFTDILAHDLRNPLRSSRVTSSSTETVPMTNSSTTLRRRQSGWNDWSRICSG